VLTTVILEELLGSALWEVGIMPLYRGTMSFLDDPESDTSARVSRVIKEAASRDFDKFRMNESCTPELWQAFLTSDDSRTLLTDLFQFRLDPSAPDTRDIRLAYAAVWSAFADTAGIPAESVDFDAFFAELQRTAEMVLAEAVRANSLAAYDVRSRARHEAVVSRLESLVSMDARGWSSCRMSAG